jgi:GNAT superfamily N-acetyltransferase
MPALTIRRAAPSDIPELVRLLVELFAQEAEFAPAPERHARGLAAIIADERVGKILVAEENGRAAGMVNFLYTVSTALGGRVALLEDMVVGRATRGSGIGKKLLAAAIETARADGCLRITLLTDPGNARAHALYEGFGFRRSSMVPFRLLLEPTQVA